MVDRLIIAVAVLVALTLTVAGLVLVAGTLGTVSPP